MKNFCIIILLLNVSFLFSQNKKEEDKNVESKLLKIDFLDPGISYEVGLGNNTTVFVLGRLGVGMTGEKEEPIVVDLYPAVVAEYRYFCNFDRRLQKNKNIKNNSANYLAVSLIYQPGMGVFNKDRKFMNGLALGPVYGLQRTYKSGFNLNFGGGIGYYHNLKENNGGVSLLVSATIGWVINSHKK